MIERADAYKDTLQSVPTRNFAAHYRKEQIGASSGICHLRKTKERRLRFGKRTLGNGEETISLLVPLFAVRCKHSFQSCRSLVNGLL